MTRTQDEIAAIVDTIRAVMPPEEQEPKHRGLFWMPAAMRRAVHLAINGRQARLTEMSRTLATATGTPEWVARMALEAVYLPGREGDLDDSDNDAPALELAVMAMGIPPASVIWSMITN